MDVFVEIIPGTDARQLRVVEGNRETRFHALWLRERSPDAQTLDPRTGQRLIEAAALPLELALAGADCDGETVDLTFSDGHRARFALRDLHPEAHAGAGHEHWDASLPELPSADFTPALECDDALSEMLEALERYGFVKVSGVPLTLDGMLPLVERLGPLRRTNWGAIADVKSINDAFDLTMTQRGLEPHTDNPYRDPIPGYIWLHCLSNADSGGDSTLTDGFMAAERLRRDAPDAFDCLTRTPSRFRYVDDDAHLESEGPLIELDARGEVVRVRYNNRTERIPPLPPEQLERYYAARRAFFALITAPELTLTPKLAPGEMLIMDNYRLLHGRTAFRLDRGIRHLRQGYVDRDTTASRRLTLRRRTGVSPHSRQESA
ncbi:MAG: gamma-butyrobetaine,2-oxoglutarate dioxygenase [Salinicola sp.]|uniref:2-trimethylaminoethylphosphonate dioxygenase n=1 Tax=uncultured Salinicola sp. TaxID=1193542 RepID=UPI000C8E4768|nr:TauD/TfdA family dioxygenase [uncultured Salinicola sp.]MAM59135.1 gamma-butyrobetaine,2-oxoglutarate dioxygenase [Salinicola sp.]